MTMTRSSAAFIATLVAAWLLFVMAVYVPDVGRGFGAILDGESRSR